MQNRAVQTPSADVLDAWAALLVAHRRITTALDVELRQSDDMSLDDYDVLIQVRLAGHPVSMSELAATVLISRPTATRIVDRLVARGWLARWHDEADRRVVRLELTSEGRAAQRRAAQLHLDGIARLVGEPLRHHDAAAVAAALGALVAATGPTEE